MQYLFKIRISLVIVCTICSCARTTTNITGSYKKPGATVSNLKTIFVSALTNDSSAKKAIEHGLEKQLEPKLKVIKSEEAFSPGFERDNMNNIPSLLEKIRSTGADVILTIALVNKETKERYIPGSVSYNPIIEHDYFNKYSAYYLARGTLNIQPDYYEKTKIYYLESNLYNVGTEELIWSAQSETYNPLGLDSFLTGYLKSLKRRMKEDGLLKK